LIATFLKSGPNFKPLHIRGEDTLFWIAEIFSDLFFQTSLKEFQHESGYLFIFDPSKFTNLKNSDIAELIDIINKIQETPHHVVYSIDDHPFFIITPPNNFTLNSLNAECLQKEAKILPSPQGCQVLDLESNYVQIEDFVLNFQCSQLVEKGVIVEDFRNFFIEPSVSIGKNTRISSGNIFKGKTKIGKGVVVFPHTFIENSVIHDNCLILPGSIIRDSFLEEGVQIGPYAHLRNGAVLKKGSKLGNFVEMKKSEFGKGSKAMHLTYIGDAKIGANVNIGAGTITCNYDGVNKSQTIIGDNVFVGSGSELIAPVTIEKDSYIAAGSTINQNVPSSSLAVARQKQRIIRHWAERRKRKK